MIGARLCRCGCGHPAAGRSAYSSDACKARWNRSGRPRTLLAASEGKPPTQAERVLAALEAAGPAGICQADFLLPSVIDGHKPIQRIAPRIKELRDEPSERVARYRLHTTGTPAQPDGALDVAGLPLPATPPAGAPRPGAGAAPLAEPDASPAGEGAASLFDLDTYRRKPRGFGDPEAA